MVSRALDIKLSVKDGDVVRRALLAVGKDGEQALKMIEGAAMPATAKLKMVDAAANATRSRMEALAASAGPAGDLFASFGTKGLVAAAGLGAIALAAVKLGTSARAAIQELDALDDTANKLGVGTGFLQEIRFAAEQLGSDTAEADGAIEKLSTSLGDIARGEGEEALKAFARLGMNVRDAEGNVRSVQDILPELADRLSRVGDQTERLSIAQDLFGKGNRGFVTALQGGSAALEEAIQKAREMGAVVDESLVKKAGDAQGKLDALSQVINAQLNTALVNMGPVLVEGAGWLANFAKSVADTVAATKREIEILMNAYAWARGQMTPSEEEAKVLNSRRDAIMKIAQGREFPNVPAGSGGGFGFTPALPDYGAYQGSNADGKGNREATKDERDAASKAAKEAARDAEALRKAIAGQIQDLEFQAQQLGRTAREQAIYNALQQNGVSINSDAGRQIAELAGHIYDETKRVKDRNDAERETEKNLKAQEEAIRKVTAAEAERQATMAQNTFGNGISSALETFIDDAGNFADMGENVVTNMLGGMEGALFNFTQSGKLSFTDMANSMIADLQRISSKMLVSGLTKLALNAFAGAFGGGVQTHPLYGASGMVMSGGVMSSPQSFSMGGRRGEVAETGPEGVLPLERTSDGRLGVAAMFPAQDFDNGGKAPVVLKVEHIGNTPMEASQRQDGNGDIILTLRELVRSEVPGAMRDTLRDSYGVMPQKVSR